MSQRDYAGFNRSVVQAAGEDWTEVREYNSWLRNLAKRKVERIERTGPLVSMLAWKIAALQQALLYRIVELADGCAKMWNEGNVLCSVLAARALMETAALTLDFEAKAQKHFKESDFEALDKLVNFQTFSSSDKQFLADNPELKRENVLDYIDRLKKRGLVDARNNYESLSEFCHPNSYGHYFAFATLDTKTGTVTFSKRKLHGDLLNHVLVVFVTLGLVENAMERLDKLVPKISKAHPSADPIRRR